MWGRDVERDFNIHTEAQWLAPLVPVLRVLAMIVKPLVSVMSFFQSLVELDENGHADSVGVNNVERAGSEALRRMQSNSGVVGGMSGSGR